ncbi:MAG: hypothetical protein E6J17_00320 [Chloroflexi bacterium]|nr:MAG: hypothetical protein E6J17_00320 [Chloroflexota bacterium]
MADADAVRGAGMEALAPESALSRTSSAPTPAPESPPPVVRGDEGVMSLLEHLTELRSRLIRAALAVGAGSVVGFLLSFTSAQLVNGIAAGPYFDFVTTLFLAFGLVMEFPIILFGLSRVGIITSQRLSAARRYVFLGIAVFATVVTPGGDLVSPFVLGTTMYILFEVSIVVIRRSGR